MISVELSEDETERLENFTAEMRRWNQRYFSASEDDLVVTILMAGMDWLRAWHNNETEIFQNNRKGE